MKKSELINLYETGSLIIVLQTESGEHITVKNIYELGNLIELMPEIVDNKTSIVIPSRKVLDREKFRRLVRDRFDSVWKLKVFEDTRKDEIFSLIEAKAQEEYLEHKLDNCCKIIPECKVKIVDIKSINKYPQYESLL